MHALHPPFDGFHVHFPLQSFVFILFEKNAPRLGGEQDFGNRPTAFCIKNPTFWTTKMKVYSMLWSIYSSVSLLCSFRSRFMRFSRPSKYCFPSVTCAFLPSRAWSTKTVVCSTHPDLWISCSMCCFLSALRAWHTVFSKFYRCFWKCARRPRWEA